MHFCKPLLADLSLKVTSILCYRNFSSLNFHTGISHLEQNACLIFLAEIRRILGLPAHWTGVAPFRRCFQVFVGYVNWRAISSLPLVHRSTKKLAETFEFLRMTRFPIKDPGSDMGQLVQVCTNYPFKPVCLVVLGVQLDIPPYLRIPFLDCSACRGP